jgi:DNA-directed RNA polymerase subunit beta'
MIAQAVENVDEIKANYNMGLITDTERYNQVIDVWTNTNAGLTEMIMSRMKSDQGGFNSVFMMLDSGARGSKEQIRQLSGMRGLMAKPQKAGSVGAEIIENPIVATLKKVYRSWNTLSLPTVLVKVLRIPLLKLPMLVT